MAARRVGGQVLLEHTGGDEAAAFHLFVEHFEEFLSELERIGKPAIKARFMSMIEQMHRDDDQHAV
jgi:hypothetical protein